MWTVCMHPNGKIHVVRKPSDPLQCEGPGYHTNDISHTKALGQM